MPRFARKQAPQRPRRRIRKLRLLGLLLILFVLGLVSFTGQVFGFEPADDIEPVEIQNRERVAH